MSIAPIQTVSPMSVSFDGKARGPAHVDRGRFAGEDLRASGTLAGSCVQLGGNP